MLLSPFPFPSLPCPPHESCFTDSTGGSKKNAICVLHEVYRRLAKNHPQKKILFDVSTYNGCLLTVDTLSAVGTFCQGARQLTTL
jgi:hypothetical protein